MKVGYGKGRLAGFVRQWRVLMELATDDVCLSACAKKHGVTERTIRRDVQALAEAGFPVVTLRDDRYVRFYLGAGDSTVTLPVSSQLDTHG